MQPRDNAQDAGSGPDIHSPAAGLFGDMLSEEKAVGRRRPDPIAGGDGHVVLTDLVDLRVSYGGVVLQFPFGLC